MDNLPAVVFETKSIGFAGGRCLQRFFLLLMLFVSTQSIHAQPALAFDDEYDVLAGEVRQLVDPTPLENDTDFEGEDLPPDAEIEILSQVQHGNLGTADDGSLTYEPTDGFTGTDSFTYRVVLGMEVSNRATVTLHVSGCTSNPPIFFCHMESSYKEKLAGLGYAVVEEGFEDDDAWGVTRSPNRAPSITHRGIIWTSNHDMPGSGLSTSTGPPRSGQWGVFSIPHGDQRIICNDPDVPHLCPPMYDGFRGARRPDGGLLYAVGGWYTGTIGGHVELVLDGDDQNPADVGWVGTGHRFFGIIDTRGFTTFELRETEGRSEDQKFIFADDFSFGFGPHTVQLPLRSGLNMFAYPVAVTNGYTSFDLINELGSPAEVDRLMRYDLLTQRFQTTAYVEGLPAGTEFPISAEEGYLVYMHSNRLVSVTGFLPAPEQRLLVPGLNILASPLIAVGENSYAFIAHLGLPGEVASVQRFDPQRGVFQTTAYHGNQIVGMPFTMRFGEAYLVHMTIAGQLQFH